MKKVITGMLLLLFCAVAVGCEASAKIDPADTNTSSSGSYEKKTTTVQQPNGDTSTKTEVKKTN